MTTSPASPVAALDLDFSGKPSRAPNMTGHGDHKFSAMVRVDYDGRAYSVQVFQLRGDHAGINKMETTAYLNGRTLPEGQRMNVRLAALDVYNDTFLSAEKVKAAKVALYDKAIAGLDWEALNSVANGQSFDLTAPGHAEAALRRIAAMKAAPVIKLTATEEPARRQVGTIDCTPTWESLIPAFVAMIENGSGKSRGFAIEELTKLVRHADAANDRAKRTLGASAPLPL